MLDLGRIVLFRLPNRHYWTKIQLAKQFADVIEMVTNLKLPKNQVGDDFGRPPIPIVTAGSCAFSEQIFEFPFLDGCESAASSAAGFSYESFESVLVDFLPPSFDGGQRDLQGVDDVIVGRSVEDHVSSQESFLAAAGNPFRWCTHTLLYERNRKKVRFLGGGQYLDEFTFRFNRRTSRSRGKLFYRLLQQVVQVDPVPYRCIIGGKNTANPPF